MIKKIWNYLFPKRNYNEILLQEEEYVFGDPKDSNMCEKHGSMTLCRSYRVFRCEVCGNTVNEVNYGVDICNVCASKTSRCIVCLQETKNMSKYLFMSRNKISDDDMGLIYVNPKIMNTRLHSRREVLANIVAAEKVQDLHVLGEKNEFSKFRFGK